MSSQHAGVVRYEREGRLLSHGSADLLSRPDAIEFRGRSNQVLVDWLGEATVWADRWPTRTGVGVLLERVDETWVPLANAMPCDGLCLTREQDVRLVFSVYVPLTPGSTYRLHLPGAVLTRPQVRIAALQREATFSTSAPRVRVRPGGMRRTA